MNKQASSPGFTVLLGVLIALPALGTDLYVPALPVLAQALDADADAGQFTLTTYFIGLAAGQLLWGPLSDRFGRKPVLLTGLAIMLASSILGYFLSSIAAVALVRLAQGLGMSSGALIGRTIVRDLHSHEQAAKMLASMTIVFSVVPMAAPVAGALLAGAAGWPSVFAAMAAVALLLLIFVRTLGETAPPERRSVRPGAIARTFVAILGDRRFLAPFALVFCAHVGILAWVSNSAFTLVRGLGVGTFAYGLMFALVMLGQITGAWASSRLVLRLGIGRLLRLGAALMLASGLAAAALAWAGAGHWLAVTLPFTLLLFGTALIVPNATAAALTPFPASAGAASSIIGALGFTVGALISTVLGAAFDGSARPMASAAALAGIGAFLAERFLVRGKA
ncbi:MAG TPA: Bcr/CflA family efflux MFS transporter [Burkholderiales bacterium]|nr:Bcr/CflA family efflux MFS transporter [Burkholderiales bacterium]